MNDNEKLPPPGQDSSLWGQDLFVEIEQPADWCTVRQAQEHQNNGTLGTSLLEQIAKGEVVSSVYTSVEAEHLLEVIQKNSGK